MKVVIIDDEKAMHLIMKHMLANIEGVVISGIFQETSSAFTFLMGNIADLIFVDINMPGESGLDFAKRLRKNGCNMNLVFVTSHKEYALPAFDVYPYDYIVKPISQRRLKETLHRAFSEKIAKEEEGLEKNYQTLVEPLTKREIEVLHLISNGMSNKEIATEFKLSEGTVKNHIVNIFGKLQVKNRVQATVASRKLKLI